jgi:hypothetical protein
MERAWVLPPFSKAPFALPPHANSKVNIEPTSPISAHPLHAFTGVSGYDFFQNQDLSNHSVPPALALVMEYIFITYIYLGGPEPGSVVLLTQSGDS